MGITADNVAVLVKRTVDKYAVVATCGGIALRHDKVFACGVAPTAGADGVGIADGNRRAWRTTQVDPEVQRAVDLVADSPLAGLRLCCS